MNLRFSRTRPRTTSGQASSRMPCERELVGNLVVDILQAELRCNLVEHASVQDVEFYEWLPPGPYFFHGGLRECAPGVSKGEPIDFMAERLENALRVTGHSVPPIHASAEHIIDDSVGCRARFGLRQDPRRGGPFVDYTDACQRNRRYTLEDAASRDIRDRPPSIENSRLMVS